MEDPVDGSDGIVGGGFGCTFGGGLGCCGVGCALCGCVNCMFGCGLGRAFGLHS